MIIVQIIYILILFFMLHTYIFYPISIYLLSLFRRKSKNISGSGVKGISVLIAAYNEEKVISERIENLATLIERFPEMEVLIGSDNSVDRTDEILSKLSEKYKWLKYYSFKVRNGKAGILNQLSKLAINPILVFTDANTDFQREAIDKLVSGFQNERVGGICGRLILKDNLVNKYESVEESKYWKYETHIKILEGKLGVLIGANGGIFAIRKELYEIIPVEKPVTDDFFLTLSVLKKGYEFIYNYDAVAYEDVGQDIPTEYKRKVRFSSTNFQTISFFKEFVCFKPFLISYAFWSHKILRWFFPLFTVIIFILSLIQSNKNDFYYYMTVFQLIFYSLAMLGFIFNKLKIKISLFSLPYFFTLANIAIIAGFIRFLKNKHSVIWESTSRE
ncbi:MAG: glycosyltransferase [Ignavibacteriaceae bacterium]